MPHLKQRKIVLVIFALLLVLIFFNYVGWLSSFKTFFGSLLGKAVFINNEKISLGDTYDYYVNRDDLISGYKQCLEEAQRTAGAEARAKILEDENAELKKQLGFKNRQPIVLVPANVIGRNLDDVDKTIIIDQGFSSGIKINQPVIIGDGIMAGKIIKVEENIAFVRLINDNQIKVAATLLNRDRSLGVVEGDYGISIRMNFIPRNEVVMVGDQVITSGLETNIPRGLLVGTVAAVENEAYQPFQQAILTPSADLTKITLVSVMLTN